MLSVGIKFETLIMSVITDNQRPNETEIPDPILIQNCDFHFTLHKLVAEFAPNLSAC